MAARFQAPVGAEQSQEFFGRLSFVSPEVDPVNGEVRLFVEMANPDQLLRPGLRGTLTIDLSADTKAKSGSQE
ncbi:MAG: hypothetical protein QM775_10635 [Pirellulales bacterium]